MTPSRDENARGDRRTVLRRRLARARLQVLATTSVAEGAGRSLLDAVAAALDGGADLIQLREKDLPDEAVLARALRLRALCDAQGALLVVNDRIEVARDAGADGVHLGQEDRSVAEARAVLGGDALIGVSTHDEAEVRRALADGADSVGVGSVFATATKGRAVPVGGPAALARIAAIAEARGVPAFAIGGITPENVAEVVAAGFRRVAVCAGVIGSADPRAAAGALVRAVGDSPR